MTRTTDSRLVGRGLTSPNVVRLGVALLLTLLTSCGTQGGPAVRTSNPETDLIEQRANEIFTGISGTAKQREAVHFLTEVDLNRSFIACMRKRAFIVKPNFAPLWAGWEPDATSGAWMGALNRPPSSHALATVEAIRAEGAPAPGKAGYRGAASACTSSSEDTNMVIGSAPGEPAGYLDVAGEFKGLVFKIDEELGPIADYTDCMEDAGIDYTTDSEGSEGWQGLYLALTNVMPAPPAVNEPPSAEWMAYLEYESTAIEADVACRGEKYDEGLRLLGPRLDDFERNKHGIIQELRAQWQDSVNRAGLVGFRSAS